MSLKVSYWKGLALSLLGIASIGSTSLLAQPTVDFLITNQVVEPSAIAIDENNKVFLTDSARHQVFRFDPDNGELSALAGVANESGTTNGPGFVARFYSPRGIVLARDGLVVADSANHQLRHITFTEDGVAVVSDLAGAAAEAGSADGAASDARFNNPSGLAVDEAGNIYIADTKNNAVRMLSPDDQVTTLATDLYEPNAVAVGPDGQLFIADTRNHAIKILRDDGTLELFAGSPTRISGVEDSYFADEALFNQPGGLLWVGGTTGLLVSDTGNHTLRRIYFNQAVKDFFPEKNGYSVETFAGQAGQPGLVDGFVDESRFNSPMGLGQDSFGGVVVADLGNHALRRIQAGPRRPPVSNPTIGWVDFIEDERTGQLVSILRPVQDTTFHNPVIIAIKREENTETLFTSGPTPGLFSEDTIPVPNSGNGTSADLYDYQDGLTPDLVPDSILSPKPDLTIKAVSTAGGRRPSEVVNARFQFRTSQPVIEGNNPASFKMASATEEAQIWYTLDGSEPTLGPPSRGPVLNGDGPISLPDLPITEVVTLKARAFRLDDQGNNEFKPSNITTKVFDPEDYLANRIGFGFELGEASSEFKATAGQRFYAPVTLELLSEQTIYTMQFNVTVGENNEAPINAALMNFESMLEKPILGTSPLIYTNIPPAMYTGLDANFNSIYKSGLFTNETENLLGVGWIERFGEEVLYPTTQQDLVTFSRAHDTRFLSENGKVILGGFSFVVPSSSSVGNIYSIDLGRPSATSDGVNTDLYIEEGPMASQEVEVVSGLYYLVGDAAPFRWFNAGDFGNDLLLNNDVVQVFQSATYRLNVPPVRSDFFNVMDSCCQTTNGPIDPAEIYDGNDEKIDEITHGDGFLDIADVFVTFRRSLDPSLKHYARYWRNGNLVAEEVPNRFRGDANLPATEWVVPEETAPQSSELADHDPFVRIYARDTIAGEPGQTLYVPIRAEIAGTYPLRVLMFNLNVLALEGAPGLTEAIEFIPDPALGEPGMTSSEGVANYAAAWLNPGVSGLMGRTELGVLVVKLPDQASEEAVYRINFEHFSGSNNGLAVFPQQVGDGLVAFKDHSDSQWEDGIPDSWRLRHFGSLSNHLSHRSADADGDGHTNEQEFEAGTDPLDAGSQLRVAMGKKSAATEGSQPILQWPTAPGKEYHLQGTSSLAADKWTPITVLTGTGLPARVPLSGPDQNHQFYRVHVSSGKATQ